MSEAVTPRLLPNNGEQFEIQEGKSLVAPATEVKQRGKDILSAAASKENKIDQQQMTIEENVGGATVLMSPIKSVRAARSGRKVKTIRRIRKPGQLLNGADTETDHDPKQTAR